MVVRLLLLHLIGLFTCGATLDWNKFHVPTWVNRGEDVTLVCDFTEQGDNIYSVKWYKSGREFYRYVPAEWPTQHAFNQPGVVVDMSGSNEREVLLRSVTLDSAGIYKCEVLSEGPLFKTLIKSNQLGVIGIKNEKYIISGLLPQYSEGDSINLNCSSLPSKSFISLMWVMNGNQVNDNHVVSYGPQANENVSTILGFNYKLPNPERLSSKLLLACTGDMVRLYDSGSLETEAFVTPFPHLFHHESARGKALITIIQGYLMVFAAITIFGL